MKHCNLLRPLLLKDLFNTEIPSDYCDFKKWVSSGNYIVRGIPSTTSIEIDVNNEYAFNHMMAFDSCRMAAAAFETMLNIRSVEHIPKSIGWIVIKSYYAAFFSAHSIMRCFGYVCSQLEKGHVNQLNGFAQAVGLLGSVKPEAGFFSGVYESSSRTILLRKMKNTHEDTWSTLVDCLNFVSQEVLSVAGLSAHKQKISADISDLVFRLTDRGRLAKGNYLSQFRNAVNYRQEHDSWHPYGKQSVRAEKVTLLLSSWKNVEDVSTAVWKESLDSYNFFVACRDIVNLNYSLINLLIENSVKDNFYKRWPGMLLNVAKTA